MPLTFSSGAIITLNFQFLQYFWFMNKHLHTFPNVTHALIGSHKPTSLLHGNRKVYIIKNAPSYRRVCELGMNLNVDSNVVYN